jgi:glycosyltransferase involved in cell wall biosynthesis
MRIAQVSPLCERVPPVTYGGTERVVSYLTEELVQRGHDVTLFASGDSLTRARLVPGVPRSLRGDDSGRDPIAAHMAMLAQVYQAASDFDVIHCHTDYVGLPLARTTSVPTLLTLHGRLDSPDTKEVFRAFPYAGLVSISGAQRAPLEGVRWAGTVYHGLPDDLYTFHPGPGQYLLFLGRISPEKGPDAAIRIAVGAGVPLRIAAKVDDADRKYFEDVVRPLLDHSLVEFLGEVGEDDKRELLAHALALLFPVDWPEPFGMVLIESLASGTPVIARRRGSVPELIADGRTGFVCETEAEMVAAVARVQTVSRAACRDEFERRFTVRHMTDAYVRIFERECGRSRVARRPADRPRASERDLPVPMRQPRDSLVAG